VQANVSDVNWLINAAMGDALRPLKGKKGRGSNTWKCATQSLGNKVEKSRQKVFLFYRSALKAAKCSNMCRYVGSEKINIFHSSIVIMWNGYHLQSWKGNPEVVFYSYNKTILTVTTKYLSHYARTISESKDLVPHWDKVVQCISR